MPPITNSHVNVEQLKELYSANKGAKALLNNLARRTNNMNTTTVDRLLALIVNEENTIVRRQELIQVLREFETLGCGRFVIGRRRQPSRFEWSVQITSLGKAAMGDVAAVDAADPTRNLEREEPEGRERAERTAISHAYQLRPEAAVRLELPANLTNKEAHRLAEFIKTLPFEDPPSSG